MKNLLLWYIPQAALFALGVMVGLNDPEPHIRGALLIGAGLAGAYTAAVMIVRDAPLHWRGIPAAWRAALLVALCLFATGPFIAAYLTWSIYQGAVLAPFLGMLWLLILAFVHNLTTAPRSVR